MSRDPIVPMIVSMYPYYNQLGTQGIPRSKVEHWGGHAFTADTRGTNGIKKWFDLY